MKLTDKPARSLFLTATIMASVFTLCFGIYEYRREHSFRCDILQAKLQLNNYSWNDTTIRVTVIDTTGRVLYDSKNMHQDNMGNHLLRKEVADALKKGSGFDIKRTSETYGQKFCYSATLMHMPATDVIRGLIERQTGKAVVLPPTVIVRSSVPYSAPLTESLERDYTFFYYTAGILLLIALVLYLRYRLGHAEEEKQRIKRQLTENAAHELKTPAATIQGYLETLCTNNNIPEEKRKEFIDRCYAQSMRMSRLLSDMSTLTRLDEAGMTRPDIRVDIAKVLTLIGEEMRAKFAEHGVTLDLDLPESLPTHGDESLIYSLFRNVFDNALAYAAGAKKFSVKAYSEIDRIYVTFVDDGVGVPPEHLRHIFERFYRIDKGRSRRLGGTGLGLAIVKNIALQYGGYATASPTPGGGLTIHIELEM